MSKTTMTSTELYIIIPSGIEAKYVVSDKRVSISSKECLLDFVVVSPTAVRHWQQVHVFLKRIYSTQGFPCDSALLDRCRIEYLKH